MDTLEDIIAACAAMKGAPTDLHIAQGSPVIGRWASGWRRLTNDVVSESMMEAFLKTISYGWAEALESRGRIETAKTLGTVNVRLSVSLAFAGSKVVISARRLPLDAPGVKESRLPNALKLFAQARDGVILFAGPTGAGKTTSLAAAVEAINQTRACHVVTIESPIEYFYTWRKALFTQREVGSDVASFAAGVIDAMRQRPEVIVIGEIRTRADAESALMAAESGHLVLATVHASSAIGGINKIVDFFPDEEMSAKRRTLANNLVAVCHQILLERADTEGSVPAMEVIANHDARYTQRIIDEKLNGQDRMDSAEADTVSQSMPAAIVELYRQGVVTRKTALNVSLIHQDEIKKRLSEAGW